MEIISIGLIIQYLIKVVRVYFLIGGIILQKELIRFKFWNYPYQAFCKNELSTIFTCSERGVQFVLTAGVF